MKTAKINNFKPGYYSWAFYFGGKMYQTKRFGLVASKQEYLMLCHAERTMKREKHKTEDSYTKHGKSKNDKQV